MPTLYRIFSFLLYTSIFKTMDLFVIIPFKNIGVYQINKSSIAFMYT